jgi:hypothetical protein
MTSFQRVSLVFRGWDLFLPPLGLTLYFRMVSGQGGSKPSSIKFPWIVSALHRTFSRFKRRINARISWLTVGRYQLIG